MATVNTQGLNWMRIAHQEKLETLLDLRRRYNWDVTGLTEIHNTDVLSGTNQHQIVFVQEALFILGRTAQKMLDSPAKQTAVGAIQEMGKLTPNQLDQFIHTFNSKFRGPIANRTWKFDLVIGALAPMRLRELLIELIASFIDPDKTIVIAVKRSQQPDTEKKLWATITQKK